MAKNSQNNLKQYFAVIPKKNLEFLGVIRHWENLQVCAAADEIWLKGFTELQSTSITIKTIPDFEIYEFREGFLFELNKNIPRRKMISGLLWHSLSNTTNIELPIQNTLFEKDIDTFKVELSPSKIECESNALMITLENLELQISNIPEFRQQNLQWVIVENMVILLGTPLLSLPGKTYWNKENHFLPSGLDFEFPILSQQINYQLNAENKNFIFWNTDGSYFLVEKNNFSSLGISSLRKTKLIL